MKKHIIIATFALASALIFSVSCAKQEVSVLENENNPEISFFTAAIDQGYTKTVLAESYTILRSKVIWETTDKISIAGSEYSVSSVRTDPTKAIFSGTGATKEDGKYRAIYPSSLYKADHFELPSVQTYAAGKFNAPMYAESETESLAFKNICGVLCLSLKGSSTDKVRYITVIAKNEGVCGKFTMSDATTLKLSNKTDPVEYSRAVSLDCGSSGVALSSTATNFYIYLPPNTYTPGMKFIITTTDDKVFEKITTVDAKIDRNNIYTFDWAPEFKEKPLLLNGEFMVNEAPYKTVKFTKGNLWADASGENASNPMLHFETNQWESNPASNGCSVDSSHVSHFTWSSSAKEAVKTTNYGDYLFCDENHKITIDGQSGCYVLNELDWWYIFSTLLGSEYGQATVNNVHGLIILSTGFSDPYAGIKAFIPSRTTAAWTANQYSAAEWIVMESEGAVFLPAAGYRFDSSNVISVGNTGRYWSSPAFDDSNAYRVSFRGSGVDSYWDPRNNGYSVRLVVDVE